MVVGRYNGVVGLTENSSKRMCGLLFDPQKSGRNQEVVVLTGWSHGGVVAWRGGRMAGWSHGGVVAWRGGRMAGWSHGGVVVWRGGRMAGWSY